jgi:hypothetical protein
MLFKHLKPSPFTLPELREDAENFRNLLQVPFKEFMAAHGIHPKVFMLKRDYDNTIKPARETTPNRPHIANRKFMTVTNAPGDKVSSLTMDRGTSVKVTEKNVRFAQSSQDALTKQESTAAPPKLTLYEQHVRKYTSFFAVNSCQQSRTLIINGLKNYKSKGA